MAKFVEVCPFDGNPCEYVAFCDDALSLAVGRNMVEDESCSRAVVKLRKE